MSERRIRVEREIAEREVKVEREQTLVVNATGVFPSGRMIVTENGEYDVTTFKTAEVAVPEPEGTINITSNGTHDVKNYATADVAVPSVDLSDYFNEQVMFTSQPSVGWLLKRLPPIEIITGTTRVDNLFNNTACERIEVYGDVSQVTTLASCFANNRQLKFLKIVGWNYPASANTANMFSYTQALQILIIDSPQVWQFGVYNPAFSFSHTIRIYVPDDLVETYKVTARWIAYADSIFPLSELPEEYRS